MGFYPLVVFFGFFSFHNCRIFSILQIGYRGQVVGISWASRGQYLSGLYIDYSVSARIGHLPPVPLFRCAVALVILRVGERLLPHRVRILLDGAQRIVMHKTTLRQFGTNRLVYPLLHVGRIRCPQRRTFRLVFITRPVLTKQRP